MRIVKKNVYYCEHCKRKGLSAIHIRKHERRCTNNPDRWCGMCENGDTKKIVDALKGRFVLADNPQSADFGNPFTIDAVDINTDEKIVTWTGEPVTLKEIRELADDCPACILAILRQSGLNRHYFHLDQFDFKKEMTTYMADRYERPGHYGCI